MKFFTLIACIFTTTCFANVHFPEGGNGSVYHVDQCGSKKHHKKKPVYETMVPPKKDIQPDYWPTR